jgi:hypothetical protein
MADLISAQKRGEIRPDVKPDFILYILDILKGAVTDERLLKLYDSRPEMVADLTNFFFYGVLSRNPEKEA